MAPEAHVGKVTVALADRADMWSAVTAREEGTPILTISHPHSKSGEALSLEPPHKTSKSVFFVLVFTVPT
eukprot:1471225-Amphidinium_carterae.2